MSPVLIDSNVLLDILNRDARWAAWSRAALIGVMERSTAVINALIYSEVSMGFASIEELEDGLPRVLYRREELPYAAGFLAGRAYLEYRRRGGLRRSPLPDFYIGAHAAVAGYELLTRDAARYRTYFPTVQLIAPPG